MLARGESGRSEAKLHESRGFSAGSNKVMITVNTPSENPLYRSGLALRHHAIHPPITGGHVAVWSSFTAPRGSPVYTDSIRGFQRSGGRTTSFFPEPAAASTPARPGGKPGKPPGTRLLQRSYSAAKIIYKITYSTEYYW